MNRLGSRLAGAALIASAAAVLSASGTASAMFHNGPAFSSGDERATAHPTRGHFVLGCRRVGLAGSRVDVAGFTDDGHRHLTVTAVPAGVRLTGIVVQGALAYNAYPPAGLGALPYRDLHSPVYRGDHPALVLRWFACGIDTISNAATRAPTSPAPTDPAAGPGRPGHTPTAWPGGAAPGGPDDPSAEVTLGPAAPPASAPPGTGTRPGAGGTGAPGGQAGSGGSPTASAAPAASHPAPGSIRLRKAAQVDLGASLYLALAMLLVVTGGLLMVAPRRLGLGVARLRHRVR